MKLRGHHCTLRPWNVDDLEALVRYANNISVARQLRDRFPHPYTRAHGVAFLTHAAAAGPPTNLAIDVDREAVGGIGLVLGTDVERFSAEIGYWLSESHWGRGIGTEALALLTDYAIQELNLLRVFALPLTDNLASMRILEKVGYVQEGILRSSCVKYGQPRDQAMYARINESWKADARNSER